MIFSIVNQKGGVGKSTTTLNLGYSLAQRSDQPKVLLVDLDVTQRDLATYSQNAGLTVSQLAAHHLDLQKLQVYDYVLIDCPPSLGEETAAALRISDVAIIPVQPESMAVSGLARILKTIEAARTSRRGGNKNLYAKILLTMVDARDLVAQDVADDVRRRLQGAVLDATIKRSPKFPEAALRRQSIAQYSPTSHGARDYQAAAMELLRDNFL